MELLVEFCGTWSSFSRGSVSMVLLHLYLVLHLCVKPGADPEGAPPLYWGTCIWHTPTLLMIVQSPCSLWCWERQHKSREKKWAGNGECKVALPNDWKGWWIFSVLCMVSRLHCNLCGGTECLHCITSFWRMCGMYTLCIIHVCLELLKPPSK